MNFHPYHLIFISIAAHARNIGKYCDITGDDPVNQCYAKEILLNMVHSPHQMAVDTDTNILYFSFDSGQGEYMPALFNLDNKSLTVLKGIKDAFAMNYDADSKDMYFGGTHGIYKYNTVLRTLKRLNVKNLDIWWLYVKRSVYFIKFPSLNTYSYVNGSIKTYPMLKNNVIHQMVIDKDDNKIFINNTGLYGIKSKGKQVILIKDHPRFLNMATDKEGYVYVCSEDGIFILSKIVQKVKKIANVHGVLGITFDKYNNIIYSDSHEIVRLLHLKSKRST